MTFDLQPILAGALVRLRPLRAEDYDAVYAACRDPLIWAMHPANDRWQEPVFREYFRGAMECGGGFAVEGATTGEVIGCTRYYHYEPEQSEIEIGYTFLVRSRWGGRYNGEMKAMLLRHAFQFVDHVVLTAGDKNFRSQRAIEKIGGKRMGMQPSSLGGDNVVYHVTPESFATSPVARAVGAGQL